MKFLDIAIKLFLAPKKRRVKEKNTEVKKLIFKIKYIASLVFSELKDNKKLDYI